MAFGGTLGNIIEYALIIGVLIILSAMSVFSIASTGLVSAATTFTDFLPIVGLLMVISYLGLRKGAKK